MAAIGMMGFIRWLLGYEDCPRCGEPLRRTESVVNRVERIWVCDVCQGRVPILDRDLVAACKRSGGEQGAGNGGVSDVAAL